MIFQADGERSTSQLLRAVQYCRSQLGLHTETRATGVGQHASNGQAERGIHSVRRLANWLRNMAESKAEVKIRGSCHLYPWSFRHAAWLLTRYRVINGQTFCQLLHDRKYGGQVAMFGESVVQRHHEPQR